MIEEMAGALKFKSAINRTFSECGGVFAQDIKDHQLICYLMEMVEDFVTNVNKKVLGVLTLGRQLNLKKVNADGELDENGLLEKDDFDTSVYILNEHLQVRFILRHFKGAPKGFISEGTCFVA